MWRTSKARFDAACAADMGARDYQEDSAIADFPVGNDVGLAILADGMGGHAAGDAASATVVSAAFRDLAVRKSRFLQRPQEVPEGLRAAALAANAAVDIHMKSNPVTEGMGSTLVAAALVGPHLFWASVGDSVLYLHRGRSLTRLNEDHSMAPQIDAMIALGQIKPEVGRNHPDRGCLTSAITGRKIARLNCPAEPCKLQAGDIVVLSSDGLIALEDDAIERLVRKNAKRPSLEIAEALIDAVRELQQENQDNTTLIVIKVLSDKPISASVNATAAPSSRSVTRLADQMEVFDAIVLDDDAPDIPARRAVGQ